MVERTGIDVFLSKDMRVSHSYIAAEIPTTSSTFTIGDGLNYHGYNNAPLEPGCTYKVYVRVVTRTSNKVNLLPCLLIYCLFDSLNMKIVRFSMLS